MTAPTPSELNAAIEADADALGFKNPDSTWKGDQEIADLFNVVSASYNIKRTLVSKDEVKAVINCDDYLLILPEHREYLALVLSGEGELDTRDKIDNGLKKIFKTHFEDADPPLGSYNLGQRSGTHAAINQVIKRDGSYAESLWGEGVVITANMVGHAANAGS